MKKIIIGFAAVLLLVGCGPQRAKEEPIKIGVIAPFSKVQAKAGADIRIALDIAQKDYGDAFPNVELIYEDDQFQPNISVSAFNKLTTLDDVVAIIGPLNGSSIESVRPLANAKEIITMTPWGSGNAIDDFLLKNSLEVADEVAVLLDTAVNNLGYRRLAILYMQNDFGQMNAEAFAKQLDELPAELVFSETISLLATDYRTELTKAKAANPDMIYIVLNDTQAASMLRQAHELGMDDIRYFGMYGFESSDTIASARGAAEGVVFTYTIDRENYNPKQEMFTKKFIARDGGVPQAAAYHTYDIYALLAGAATTCNQGRDVDCMREYIFENTVTGGVSGSFRFENGEVKRPLFLRTVRDGEFTNYESKKPAVLE